MAAEEVELLDPGPRELRLAIRIPGRTPADVYAQWVDPALLTAWWGPEAQLDVRPGGTYALRWSKIDATLRGEYLRVVPGRLLEFTWRWESDPHRSTTVQLRFDPDGPTGTRLEVTHGRYEPDARDAELRQEHLDGWRFHLPRLRRALVGGATPP